MRFLLPLVALTLASAAPLPAQRLLERADSLLQAGELAQARALLQEWQRANPPSARLESAARARALYLSARLTENAQQALEHYLTLALSYPTAREAPDALLRLGQGLLAAGENRRALAYLERLLFDYPAAPNRTLAQLWLARAQLATGNRAGACTTAGNALKSGDAKGELASLLQAEEKSACGTAEPVTPAPAATPVVRDSAAAADDARFALQSAAFRNLASANAIAAQLSRAGFAARVAHLPNNELALVRIGRFKTRAEAAAEAARLKQAGFNVIIVDDANREKRDE